MSTRNIKTLRYLVIFVAILSVGVISSSNVSAVSYDTYTDGDGVVWDRETTDDGDIYIGIKSVPSGVTTVNVPSINDVASGKDTYFLDSICSRYSTPDCSGVVSDTANVTKLDMTNTSKIQVKNVSQMFDNTHEVELVFGENMVIADPVELSLAESDYVRSVGFEDMESVNPYAAYAGAFDGMKVKLTNLHNIKYIGWNAFRGADLNADSRSITINNNQTVGGYVFAGSNIESLDIDATEVGQGFASEATALSSLTIGDNVRTIRGGAFFRDAALKNFDSKNIETIGLSAFEYSGLTSATFGSSINSIEAEAFRNTTLGAVDFSNASVEKIAPRAFMNAGITEINLGNVGHIGARAFMNNLFTEVTIPKSFKPVFPGGSNAVFTFAGTPLKKITVAFDLTTLTQGLGFSYIVGEGSWGSIEEIVVLAPYSEDEPVIADHDYDRLVVSSNPPFEEGFVRSLKNVIPRWVFQCSGGDTKPKKLILDDRLEAIGELAFSYTYLKEIHTISDGVVSEDNRLPSHLKFIGANAFQWSMTNYYNGGRFGIGVIVEMDSLPESLEYIDKDAFLYDSDFVLNNFDLPNLKYIGPFAFYYANVKNISLSIKPVESNHLFMGSHIVDSITIDYDIFSDSNGFHNFTCWNANCSVEPGIGWSSTNRQHFTKIKFTENALTSPGYDDYGSVLMHFQGIDVDELDLSEAPWTVLPDKMAVGAKIGTLKLPANLERIGAYAFNHADIENPVVIPDTVTEISEGAFNLAPNRLGDTNIYDIADFTSHIAIESLPSSLTKVGAGAFFMDDGLTADVDLSNLTELGASAFQETNVRDVTIGGNISKLGPNAFYGVPSLRNVTIDVDLYNVTRDYNDIVYNPGTSYERVELGYCYMQSGDPCDGDTDEIKRSQRDANFYDSFVATFGVPDHPYGTLIFTENAGEPSGGFENSNPYRAYFYGIKADKIDLSATNWTATGLAMFQDAEVGELLLPHALEKVSVFTFYNINAAAKEEGSGVEPVAIAIPATLKNIDYEGFMRARAEIDGLPEGLTTINSAAFYEADVTDDLVIPSTVTLIGPSAFNAGSEDVQYNTVTIKPNLTMNESAGQLIHQMFWNAKITDRLIIASSMLPALSIDEYIQADEDLVMPEFYNMTMKEAILTNIPKITREAFQNCANLEKADLSSNGNLEAIDKRAFQNDAKLDTILFSPVIKNETVTIGEYAFEGTAFKTMGDSSKQFDLTAANFDATDGFAFSKMPKLETVDIPRNFSNKTVPEATFANDPELRLVTIDYKTETIDNAAFSNDNKLESIFIWGNTEVLDENIAGHGGGEAIGPEYGPTIPEPTDIYAYSTSPAEDYAALPVRQTFDGDFYALDEVLYLTSNKPTVLVNDDATDFDKSDLIVYAMRRDGIILESDSWATYDGNAYQRATSDIDFEAMAAAIQENPVFASIHDTPVPMDELDVTTNVNFENIDFAMVPDPDNANIRKITLLYNDKYTDHLADTDILPYQEGDPVPPVVPDTGATKAWKSFMDAGLPIVTIAMISLVGGALIFKKRH